ncbi:MAG: head morphogenesis protein [Deltaproteobacteria bacterium]|nr:head morphogenesis protein [Deltaproteobacteria bacterium]
MCNIDNSRYELVHKARVSAEEILDRYYRVHLRKAWELDSSRGFDGAVAELASLLRSTTEAADKAALKAVVDALDVDWHKTTAEQRSRLIDDALTAAGRKTVTIPQDIKAPLGDAADEVVSSTRAGVRSKHKLAIGADFNAVDKRIVDHLKTSEANFITDEYGVRLDDFGRKARGIVSHGIDQGLGNDDITAQLQKAAEANLVNRSKHYFQTVANSFIGRGRTFATLSSFNEAGIERYVYEAVLDEATTEQCRFYHGKVFTVNRGLNLFDRVDAEPDMIKELTPWVRKGRDEDDNEILYVKRKEGITRLATIAEPGIGQRDKIGTYSNALKESQLSELGCVMPPTHGL